MFSTKTQQEEQREGGRGEHKDMEHNEKQNFQSDENLTKHEKETPTTVSTCN